MPLPLILGIGAAIAGLAGVGSGVHGATKMKEANDIQKIAMGRHKINHQRFDETSEKTNKVMDSLGELELQILKGFEDFSNLIEKIQNRPQFKEYEKDGIKLPKYDKEELKQVSIGAGVLLGGLGGATVGTAGGFAAAGAATTAVMALGTASTGATIASLSGVAATNATLAALGGGAVAAGGGGMALGTTILGAATLGVGLLVGGAIFNITGSKLSNKANEIFNEVSKEEETINQICDYLDELHMCAKKYINSLEKVRTKYLGIFNYISYVINDLNHVDWNTFDESQKIAVQNTVLLVGLLYNMCKVSIVKKSENENDINTVNHVEINCSLNNADEVLQNLAF